MDYSRIGLAKLCGWFGITRQAYYQYNWRASEISTEEDLIIKEVIKIRQFHRQMGTRKIYDILNYYKKKEVTFTIKF